MTQESRADANDTSFLARIVDAFLQNDLAPLLILLSLLGGAIALYVTPREEEPQIVVPLADVLVEAPGLPVEQVEAHAEQHVRGHQPAPDELLRRLRGRTQAGPRAHRQLRRHGTPHGFEGLWIDALAHAETEIPKRFT